MPFLLFALRYWRVIAAILSVVALVGGAGIYIEKIKHDAYAAGYTAGYADAQAKCDRERSEQEAANAKVMSEATKALDDLQSKLELKDIQLADYLKGIDLAADAAPDAGLCGLSAGSLRRLNRAVE